MHPIIPVLDETRALVLQYNQLYQEAVLRLGNSRVRWLDFHMQLLDPVPDGTQKNALNTSGYELKPQYKLDGTHIHPCYIPLVSASLK